MHRQSRGVLKPTGMLERSPRTLISWAVVLTLGLCGYFYLYKPKPNSLSSLKSIRPGEGRFTELTYAPLKGGKLSKGEIKNLRSLLRRPKLSPRIRAALLIFDNQAGEAIRLLQRENLMMVNDSAVQADLAAAYIARGDAGGQYYDYIQALKFADSAEKLDPLMPAASFNLALALERTYLLSQAQTEWKKYLLLDSSSQWGKEALTHFRSLRSIQERKPGPMDYLELVGRQNSFQELEAYIRLNPSSGESIRSYAEETLFTRWALDQLQGHSAESQRDLDSLRTVGAVLLNLYGDRFLADSVEAIDRSRRGKRFSRLYKLAKGHGRFARGLYLSAEGEDWAAYKEFKEASRLLEREGSPFWLAAAVYAADSAMYAGRPQETVKRISSLRRVLGRLPFTALRGRAYWVLGVAHLRLSDLRGSLSSYLEALYNFNKVQDLTSQGALCCLIAEGLRFQGDSSGAWQNRYEALKNSMISGSAVWLHNSIFDAAESLLKAHEPELALRFQSELVESPLCPRDSISLSEAFIRRARSYLAVGNRYAAVRDLRSASNLLKSVSSYLRRRPLEADISMVMGEAYLGIDPNRSISLLTDSIGFYKNHNRVFRLPGLLQKRASALIAMKKFDEAETDIVSGIREVSNQYGVLISNPLQEEYRVQSRELFDEAVAFQLDSRKDAAQAFCYAELSRQRYQGKFVGGRSRICQLHAGFLESRLERLRQDIPDNTYVVGYYLLGDRLLVWLLSRGALQFTEITVGKDYLRGLVEEFVSLASRGKTTARFQKVAENLSSILLPRSIRNLRESGHIIFVPDSFLFGLPFAALTDNAGFYLVSRHIVSSSPSFDFMVSRNGRAAKAGVESRNGVDILVVGDPEFDRRTMAELPRLPSSLIEIGEIYKLFSRVKLLEGREATRSNVLSLLPGYSVVHISSHASMREDYPLLSFIALAGEREMSSSLYARDIYELNLREVRLVVLATCESAKGVAVGDEGIAYLSQAFLSAGAAVVIGSLWRVRDDDSQTFFREFYREIKSGSDVYSAMHIAQIRCISARNATSDKSLAWAAFTIIGGF